jgi:hypothetical protein
MLMARDASEQLDLLDVMPLDVEPLEVPLIAVDALGIDPLVDQQ